MSTVAPAASAYLVDHVGQAGELLLEVLLRVEAAVDGEPGGAGNGARTGAGSGLTADDEHRTPGFLALNWKAGPLLEQDMEARSAARDADHVLEGVDALVDIADVRLTAGGLYAQGDRASARVPDDAAGGLRREHRDRRGIDEPGLA